VTLEGFRIPKDPHPDEPEELTPGTRPKDEAQKRSADELAHEQRVRPDYVARKVGEGGELDEENPEETDRP
jgi:hypothetical protein